MDDRNNPNFPPPGSPEQTKLESGAGLQDSRLNEDFLNWLNKWGPRILYGVLAVVLVYVGLQWFGRYQERITDQAFAELTAALESQDPQLLLTVAAAHPDRAAIEELARLQLGRIYVATGIERAAPNAEPGAEPLTDDEVAGQFRLAIEQFRLVLDDTRDTNPIFAQQARWGIITSHMSLGEREQALAMLDEFEQNIDDLGAADTQRGAAAERRRILERGDLGTNLMPRQLLPDHALAPEELRRMRDEATQSMLPGSDGPPAGPQDNTGDANTNDLPPIDPFDNPGSTSPDNDDEG